jgi:hypothetical protein
MRLMIDLESRSPAIPLKTAARAVGRETGDRVPYHSIPELASGREVYGDMVTIRAVALSSAPKAGFVSASPQIRTLYELRVIRSGPSPKD